MTSSVARAQHTLTVRRDVQQARPTIGRMGPALDQATVLELVNEGNHAARRDAQHVTHLVLGTTFGRHNRPHQRKLTGLEVHFTHEGAESPRHLEAELGEQKSDRLPERQGWVVFGVLHDISLYQPNQS